MIVPRLAFFFFLDFPPFPSAMLGEVASTGRRDERRAAIRGRDLSSSWKRKEGEGQNVHTVFMLIKCKTELAQEIHVLRLLNVETDDLYWKITQI